MSDPSKWIEMNEQHLSATLNWLHLKLRKMIKPAELKKQVAGKEPSGGCFNWFKRNKSPEDSNDKKMLPPLSTVPSEEEIKKAATEMMKIESSDPPPALMILARQLGLSSFDRQLLSLCVAIELDTRISNLCALAQDDLNKPYPTFALAMAMFDDPEWNVLSPQGPLRYWRLIEINQPGAQALTVSALRADERIVNYLKGLNYLDDRLAHMVDPLGVDHTDGPLPASQQQVADEIVKWLRSSISIAHTPVIQLPGSDSTSKKLIAQKVANVVGINLHSINIPTLPIQLVDVESLTRLWQRESLLMPLGLYIDSRETSEADQNRLNRFLEQIGGIVFLDEEDLKTDISRNNISFDINKPTPKEQDSLNSDHSV